MSVLGDESASQQGPWLPFPAMKPTPSSSLRLPQLVSPLCLPGLDHREASETPELRKRQHLASLGKEASLATLCHLLLGGISSSNFPSSQPSLTPPCVHWWVRMGLCRDPLNNSRRPGAAGSPYKQCLVSTLPLFLFFVSVTPFHEKRSSKLK